MTKEYIPALEYGLPPTAGEGVGFDRIEMLLTNNASIPLLHSVTSCANR